MKDLFVPYDIALLAKEKGFKEECFRIYANYYTDNTIALIEDPDKGELYPSYNWVNKIAAPLYQQLVDWFREKHNL